MKEKDYKYEENDLMQLDKLTVESVKADLEVILPEKYMPSKITEGTVQIYKDAIKKAIKDNDGSKEVLIMLRPINFMQSSVHMLWLVKRIQIKKMLFTN